ncbi:hypothetical protein ES703_124444 [subsurface metagenome]
MSLSVVSTPMSSVISVSSSSSSKASSISLPRLSTAESEELILSRVLPSRSLKNSAVLVKMPITATSRIERFSQSEFRIYLPEFQVDSRTASADTSIGQSR